LIHSKKEEGNFGCISRSFSAVFPMAAFTVAELRKRLDSRVDPLRSLVLRSIRGQQKATVVEAGKHELQLAVEKLLPIASRVEFSFSTGFPVEERIVTGWVHWNSSDRTHAEIGVATASQVPPELLMASSESLRTNIRYQCKIVGTLKSSIFEGQAPATAINYSRNGLCLQTTRRIDIGEDLEFGWQDQGERVQGSRQRALTAHVRWVSAVADTYLIGCETPFDSPWAVVASEVLRQLRP
jgi:hypothetical protein